MMGFATTSLLNSRFSAGNAPLLAIAEAGPRASAEEVPAAAPAQATPPARQQQQTAQYGYHNTFHQHATPSSVPASRPPRYQSAAPAPYLAPVVQDEVLPGYTCTVFIGGQLGMKSELASPFMEAPAQLSFWNDVYVELNGTQLRIYRQKLSNSRLSGTNKRFKTGKLIKAYSMQHAEAGIAVDFDKGDLVPKTRLAKMIPPAARQKVYETEPHLFEPVREHVIRVRLESEQFLLCAGSQTEMLDWVESLAAAIDIAMPLEDRSEPRYRSLPRRARRQREIEGRGMNVSGNLEERQNLVRQQERLFMALYPHLAADHDIQHERELAAAREVAAMSNSRPTSQAGGNDDADADPDADDLDRSDALAPTTTLGNQTVSTPTETSSLEIMGGSYFQNHSQTGVSAEADSEERQLASPDMRRAHSPEDAANPSTDDAKQRGRPTPQLTPSSALRYRRRCAPVLLLTSPRSSGVIVTPILTSDSKKANKRAPPMMRRVKIDNGKQRLIHFDPLPPRYEAHNFDAAAQSTATAVRPVLMRDDTARSNFSTVSKASVGPESAQADVATAPSSDDTEPSVVAQQPSAMASRESVAPERADSPTSDNSSSTEESNATTEALPMTREVSRSSMADSTDTVTTTTTSNTTDSSLSSEENNTATEAFLMRRVVSKSSLTDSTDAAATTNTTTTDAPTQPPAPNAPADAMAASPRADTSSGLSQFVVKRARRLSFHAKLLGKRSDKSAAKMQDKPVIPASEAADAQTAAYGALMF